MPVPKPPPGPIRRRSSRILRLLAAAALVAAMGSALSPPAYAGPEPRGVWPLTPAPEVVARFAPPASEWGSGHRGVDLLGMPGRSVRAALAGRVSFAGRIAGRGIVVVDHGDTRTTYEPVHALRRVGAEVQAGDRLGVLETFGSHCFPRSCLHWGWLRGERYLDPLLLVGAGPIRLLPLWRASPVLPYAARPWSQARSQARGCACW